MEILKRRNPMTLLLLIVFTTLFVMIFVTTNCDSFFSNNIHNYEIRLRAPDRADEIIRKLKRTNEQLN